MTAGVSSPAILNMLGTMSSRPWDAVKVVASAPLQCAVHRARRPPRTGSTTSGTTPQAFADRPPPVVSQLAHLGGGVIG